MLRMTKTDLVNQAKLSPTRFIFGSEISHGKLEMTRTIDSSLDPTTRLRMTGCWVLGLEGFDGVAQLSGKLKLQVGRCEFHL